MEDARPSDGQALLPQMGSQLPQLPFVQAGEGEEAGVMVFGPGLPSTVTEELILLLLGVQGPSLGQSGCMEMGRVILEQLPSHLGQQVGLDAQLWGLCHLNQGDLR